MILYTIGFSKKSASQFFSLLKQNGVKKVIDIRLNNKSQLAGFTKVADIEYFLKEIADIEYIYLPEFAPTDSILSGYKDKKNSWEEYEEVYNSLLNQRNPLERLDASVFDNGCLLCSEHTAVQCHRRLAAEYIATKINGLKIMHL